MEIEYIILLGLFLIFLMSFCGLLRKIRQTYENERNVQRRSAGHHDNRPNSDIFINNSFLMDPNWEREINMEGESGGIYPSAPPPYGFNYSDPPPKYEDLFKETIVQNENTRTT